MMQRLASLSRLLLGITALLLMPTVHADSDTPTPSSREPEISDQRPVVFNAHWDSDAISNLRGGIRTGTTVDSTAQLGLTVNGDHAGLPGATFHAALFAIHSGHASERLIGDSLGVSNIEGRRNGLVLADAYWQQQWRPWLSTQVGVFDLNSVFDITDSASQLLNSSFGADPGITGNFQASTFPLNGTGAVATLNQGPWILQAGILQGVVDQQTRPFGDGVLNLLEGRWQPADNQAIRLGLWQRRGSNQPEMHGLYVSVEQPLTHSEQLVGFARAGISRATESGSISLDHYLSTGFNWQGVLPHRPEDHLTAGITRAIFDTSTGHQHEQVTELAYVFRVNRHLYLQPDLQYVDRPSGTYPAAWVATLRIHIE